jgi:hypothetical protein
MKKTLLSLFIVMLGVNFISASSFVDPLNLEIGKTYTIFKITPLMPEIDPVNPEYALTKMKQIPNGGKIKPIKVEMKNGKPWYKVLASDQSNNIIGFGFVNSTALIGQNLEVINSNSKANTKNESYYLYDIVEDENYDFRDLSTQKFIHRIQYRVKLKKEYSETELTEISKEIISQAPKAEAISILFYLPDTETNGAYTAGLATWSPNGKWEDADKNYTKKLIVKYGGALGTLDKKNVIDLPLSKKKEMFFNLVKYEDQGMNGYQSSAQIAKDYGITVEKVNKIGIEGILKNWPMP